MTCLFRRVVRVCRHEAEKVHWIFALLRHGVVHIETGILRAVVVGEGAATVAVQRSRGRLLRSADTGVTAL